MDCPRSNGRLERLLRRGVAEARHGKHTSALLPGGVEHAPGHVRQAEAQFAAGAEDEQVTLKSAQRSNGVRCGRTEGLLELHLRGRR